MTILILIAVAILIFVFLKRRTPQPDKNIEKKGYHDLLDDFVNDEQSGRNNADKVNLEYYNDLSEKLAVSALKNISRGSNGDEGNVNFPTLKSYFSQNYYPFQCCETSETMLRDINSYITDEKGIIVGFSKFKRRVSVELGKEFDPDQLESDYNTAIGCAQMAISWPGLQIFDALEYSAVGFDDCKICKSFDRLTLAADDPFWDVIYPPNHPGCRCTVIPGIKSRIVKNRAAVESKINAAQIAPFFRRNFGKTAK